MDIYEKFGIERPSEKKWDPNDPRAESIEVLREKADIAEAARMALLWQTDPAAALVKEQEKVDRDAEVAQILKDNPHLARKPKSVVTEADIEAVKEVQKEDPEKAKAMMQELRRKEIEEFRRDHPGAKFGYGNEVMCDNCKTFHLVIQRCSQCRLAWYCSTKCQRDDWPTHRHVCKEEKRKRLEAEAKAKEAKEKGSEAVEALEESQEKEKKKKKKKEKKSKVVAVGEQNPMDLEPDYDELVAAQEEMLGRKINRLTLKRFTDKERHAYETLMSMQMKDVIESLWKSFHIAGLVPFDEPGNRRCVRELWKFAGSKPEFHWIAPKGQEWVGTYNKDSNSPLDKKVSKWLKQCFKEGRYKLDDQNRMDYQTFVRMLCARRIDYRMGK